MMIFVAGKDEIVSSRAAEDFAVALKVGTHVLLPSARHEILQEADSVRLRFWAAFDAYMGLDETVI
jgi:lysophospholipase